MSEQKKKKNVNAMFNVLNSEFGGKSNSRSSGGKKSNVSHKKRKNKSDAKKSKSADNIGLGFVKFLILFVTALALAWVIFMPSHSLEELTAYLSGNFSQLVEHIHSSDSQTGADSSAEQTSSASYTSAQTTAATTTASTSATTTKTSAATTVHYVVSPDSAEPDNIKVYLKSQLVAVYDSEGGVIKVFICSSGKSSTPTRTGDYAIHHQYRWRLMIGDCYAQYASAFSGSYLFHSIPYNRQDASTMSNASYDKLGSGASAGCIRLCCRDAKWIYDNCKIGTKVKVVNEFAPDGLEGEEIPVRIKKNKYSGWDPTDPSAQNPYNKL